MEDRYHEFLMECTEDAGRGRRCWLLDRAREINEVILGVGMHLREASRSSGDTGVALAVSTCGHAYGSAEYSRRSTASRLTEDLLTKHPCITGVEIDRSAMYRPSLAAVLTRCQTLESLTIFCPYSGFTAAAQEHDLGARKFDKRILKLDDPRAIVVVESLRLDVACLFRNRRLGEEYDTLFVALKLRLKSLTTLDVAKLSMTLQQATRFIEALAINDTIVDLAVGQNVFPFPDRGVDDTGKEFIDYLSQHNCKLRKLKISCGAQLYESVLTPLSRAVSKMAALQDLTLDEEVDDRALVLANSLFVGVAALNTSLRRLALPFSGDSASWVRRVGWGIDVAETPRPDATLVELWMQALRSPSSVLRELTIDLHGLHREDCRAFFDAVAQNKALKMVALRTVPRGFPVEEVCKMIRDCGLSDRVAILDLAINERMIEALPQCPEITSVTVTLWTFPPSCLVPDPTRFVFDTLSRCPHVTSIRVRCDDFSPSWMSVLAAYVRGPSPLRRVTVVLGGLWHLMGKEERRSMETELASALASNSRLVKIGIHGLRLCKRQVELLCDGARTTRNLTSFGADSRLRPVTTPFCFPIDVNCRCCTPDRPTEIFNVRKHAMANIQECVSRNASLVREAVQFVLGDRDAVRGGRAFELLHDHPDILEMVRERADVTMGEARAMIASTLPRLRRCSLDEFMRMAGVVQDRVECIAEQPGAGLKLSDLNSHCWLHICRFLKIADVLESPQEGRRVPKIPQEDVVENPNRDLEDTEQPQMKKAKSC